MAQNTPFAVRMEDDEKEKLLNLIEESGRSNKDFMSLLLSSYELNKAKVEIPTIAEDINHLEALTQQINSLYLNMGKRIQTVQKTKDMQFEKDTVLLKEKIQSLTTENEKLKNDKNLLEKKCEENLNYSSELLTQVKQLDEVKNSNAALINSLNDKISTLSGIIAEYKNYKTENEELKKILADAQSRSIELTDKINSYENNVTSLNSTIENLKTKNKEELQRLQDNFEIQKQKSLLEQQMQHQEKLQKNHEEYSNKVEQYENKYKKLLEDKEALQRDYENKNKLLLEEKETIQKEHEYKYKKLLEDKATLQKDYENSNKTLLNELESYKKVKNSKTNTPKEK